MKIRVIILNYNGEQLLPECLPSIVRAAQNAAFETRVAVIDNQSQDRSLEVLRRFKDVIEVIQAPANRVLCSYNDYVKDIDDEVVILLNNDIKVREDFVDPIGRVFQNYADACFVASKSYLFDGKTYEGNKTKMWMKWGLFGASCRYPGFEKEMDQFGYSMQAGIVAFDRKKFLALGGFDDLYLPGRLEDSDICFRAWKRGWKGYYEPKSVIFHKGGAAFHARFGKQGTLRINARNTYLFMWKNLQDPRYIAAHLLFLVPRILVSLMRGKTEWFFGFFMALARLPRALQKRKQARAGVVKTDAEVFHAV